VTPDTLLAWHRALIAQVTNGHLRRGPGRPRVTAEIRAWVVRMATENRCWGYTRIQGALANLDHHVCGGTIATIQRQRGIEPAPERQKRTTWQEFLCTHRGVLAAIDFFTVEVWSTTIRNETIRVQMDSTRKPVGGGPPLVKARTYKAGM
jgi:putative transposase